MINTPQNICRCLSQNLLLATLVLTISTIALVHTFNIPNPAIICLLVVVFFTFVGGFYYGSISGLLTLLYCGYFFSQTGKLFYYTDVDLYKIIVIFVAVIAMVVMVGRLKKQVDSRTQELEQLNEKFRLLSTVDGLTGILNRRCFEETIIQEWRRSFRGKVPIAIVMIDVDYFKKYNDTYGHQAGDECLRQIAEIMAKHVHRSGDYIARYGGEEFIVLLSNTTISGAAKVGEDIRLLIENLRLPHKSSDVSPYVTVSVGVMSLIPEADRCVEDLVKKADQALYYAKRHGRNCVISYSDNIEETI